MTVGTPRLAPLPRDRWNDETTAALRLGFPDAADALLASDSEARPLPNVLTTLLHHPALVGPFLNYNRVLLQEPTLGHRVRELIVLRVASRTGCEYEWAQHVRLAASAGLTPEEIDAVGRGPDAATWKPFEADVLAATDQLIDRYCIDDDTWARLAEHLDERGLVELVFVAGTYTCLAMAFNSFGLQLDPDLQSITPIPHRATED